jgi:hypothetical protein
MALTQVFLIRYGVFRPLLSLLGAGPRFSKVTVDGHRLQVRMGWMFRAEVPLTSVTEARPHTGFVGGIGVHGGRGWWLVNGGIKGIVDITIHPPAQARVLGVRARLRRLQVGVEAPEELLAVLSGSRR